MVSSQVIVIQDPNVEDGVVGAETKVEDGAEANGLQRKVVLIGGSQGHQSWEDGERRLDAEEGHLGPDDEEGHGSGHEGRESEQERWKEAAPVPLHRRWVEPASWLLAQSVNELVFVAHLK